MPAPNRYLFCIDCDETLIPVHLHKLLKDLESMVQYSKDGFKDKDVVDFKAALLVVKNPEASLIDHISNATAVFTFIQSLLNNEVLCKKIASNSFNSSGTRALFHARRPILDVIKDGADDFMAFHTAAMANGHAMALVSYTFFPGMMPAILLQKGLSGAEIEKIPYVGGFPTKKGLEFDPGAIPDDKTFGKTRHMLVASGKLGLSDLPADLYVLSDDTPLNLIVAQQEGCLVGGPTSGTYHESCFKELLPLAEKKEAKSGYVQPLRLPEAKKAVRKPFTLKMPTQGPFKGGSASSTNQPLPSIKMGNMKGMMFAKKTAVTGSVLVQCVLANLHADKKDQARHIDALLLKAEKQLPEEGGSLSLELKEARKSLWLDVIRNVSEVSTFPLDALVHGDITRSALLKTTKSTGASLPLKGVVNQVLLMKVLENIKSICADAPNENLQDGANSIHDTKKV